MKKISSFILGNLIVLISVLNTSCSSDFKIGADYKDYTVVFGLLARSDTAQYIKITKGFYDEKQNNLLIAKIADSIYYKNLEVKIYKLNGSTAVDSILLRKVDLNNEGYKKDTGTFVNNPNIAYKFKEILDPSKIYRLSVKNLSTGKIVYGETDILDNTKIIMTPPYKLQFSQSGLSTTTFYWKSPTNVSIYDLYLRFNYEEKDNSTGILSYKSTMIPLQRNINNFSTSMSAIIQSDDFFTSLQGGLTKSSNITRYLDTPDVVLSAGGLELKKYIDVSSSQGGITFDQIKPIYTNMKGDNVLGLFSSRVIINSNQVQFDIATHDSILNGRFTRSLNFAGVSSR